jgi:hypothetical protein
LRQVGFQANRRLLDVQTISHDCAVGEDAFRRINEPVVVAGQRASALRFASNSQRLKKRRELLDIRCLSS